MVLVEIDFYQEKASLNADKEDLKYWNQTSTMKWLLNIILRVCRKQLEEMKAKCEDLEGKLKVLEEEGLRSSKGAEELQHEIRQLKEKLEMHQQHARVQKEKDEASFDSNTTS